MKLLMWFVVAVDLDVIVAHLQLGRGRPPARLTAPARLSAGAACRAERLPAPGLRAQRALIQYRQIRQLRRSNAREVKGASRSVSHRRAPSPSASGCPL